MQTSLPAAGQRAVSDFSRVAQDLQIRKVQVESVVQLLDEGNTVPFITRYRKERTGGLGEDVIRKIQARVRQLRDLAQRKQTILKSVENQGRLTDELREAILAAETPRRLEDLYLPFKPKKRTLAAEARERGLGNLAEAVWSRDPAVADLGDVVAGMLDPEKQLNSPEDVLAGVRHILAEQVAEDAEARAAVRAVLWDTGKVVAQRNESLPEGKGNEFRDYFKFSEPVRHLPPHRTLALNRGERTNVLKVRVEFDAERARRAVADLLPLQDHPHRDFLLTVVDDALARLLVPSLERELRRELTDKAHEHAVAIFARNLRSLLLQPPLRGKRVLAIDPGMRTGCKLAALDESGEVLEHAVIYPNPPKNQKTEAKRTLERLIRRHQTSVIALGNGTGCRETERLVSDLIAELDARRRGEAPPEATPPQAEPAGQATPPAAENATPPAPPEMPEPAAPAAADVSEGSDPPAPVAASPEAAAAPPPDLPPAEAAPAETGAAPEEPVAATPPPLPPETSPPPVGQEGHGLQAPPPLGQEGHGAQETPPPLPETPPPLPEEPLPEAPEDLAYVIVNEAGASDYSASPLAAEEFPQFDATTRGTVSIGRRLQDPLSELVKIDPQHIGVGLYQHDVKPKNLKESLEGVVESCVNQVGVDVNTASVPLLRYVSGLNQLVARDLVEYRRQHGPFRSREQLLEVPNFGPARFTQAAGFLKIPEGDNPLDVTWVHPESYDLARAILAELGFAPEDLRDRDRLAQLREKLASVNAEELAGRLQAGVPTVADILETLARPGRDPREDLPPPVFKKGILKLDDLRPGMELKGTVQNVVDFGAFVDIGVKESGLVHISQMANRFVKSPYEVVAVGDVVTVWVVSVDTERQRVSLTMIPPGTERRPAERGGRRGQQRGQPGEPAPGAPRGEGGGERPPFRGARERGGPRRGGRRGPPPKPAGPPAAAGETPAGGPRPQPRPAPRPPRPPKPLPKLTEDALERKVPLHTFGELEAFFKAKHGTERPAEPEPAPQRPPEAAATAPEPPPPPAEPPREQAPQAQEPAPPPS